MPLSECGLNLNDAKRELMPHGTADFPCAAYAHVCDAERVISWHWHEELEFICAAEGELCIQVPGEKYTLKKGDCACINSNVLHYAAGKPYAKIESFVFSPLLVAGAKESVFYKKYMAGLLNPDTFLCCVFENGGSLIGTVAGAIEKKAGEPAAAALFGEAFSAMAKDCPGYEFLVRENLSKLCFMLYRRFADGVQPEADEANGIKSKSLDGERIKKMLDFIHAHYGEAVSVPEIAASADVGARECLRCFQRTIQLSPIQYLLKYRVSRGAELLLNSPAGSVSEIALTCGFDSPSNFSKTFRRFYKRTPREYRKEKSSA